MDRLAVLAGLALLSIAGLAGGAAFRLVGLVDSTAAALTLALVAVVVLAGLVLGSGSRPRGRTPYWH